MMNSLPRLILPPNVPQPITIPHIIPQSTERYTIQERDLEVEPNVTSVHYHFDEDPSELKNEENNKLISSDEISKSKKSNLVKKDLKDANNLKNDKVDPTIFKFQNDLSSPPLSEDFSSSSSSPELRSLSTDSANSSISSDLPKRKRGRPKLPPLAQRTKCKYVHRLAPGEGKKRGRKPKWQKLIEEGKQEFNC
ncbi:hypothetical protein DAMA08_015610 [Martiniozyma asiatica (nom. inval.)]|nr:hypothetical protein DAMA08_015610 [Martiniozyma asiatica]